MPIVQAIKVKVYQEPVKPSISIANIYPGDLQAKGARLQGRCPFHEDNKPSFSIYTKTNTWYCFSGCGGGDVISFYMKLYSVNFKQATQDLNQII